MADVNPYNLYKNQSILLAPPEELTLMLYNGCIKFIRQAQAFIDSNNISGANTCIIRAQDIILELLATLDMSYPVSGSLSQLYNYINRRLIDANIEKNTGILEEVLNLVTELRDTWAEAVKSKPLKIAAGRG